MSVADTNAPPWPKKAIDSGMSVSFIQNCADWSLPTRNSIPSAPPSPVTCMRPRSRSASVTASHTQKDFVVRSGGVIGLATAQKPGGAAAGVDALGAGGGTTDVDGKAGGVDGAPPGPRLHPPITTAATTTVESHRTRS